MSKRYVLLDGERRVRAARVRNIPVLKALVFKQRPTELQILKARAAFEFHHLPLTWGERIDFAQRLRSATGCSVNELAAMLHISQSLASKLGKGAEVAPEVRAALDAKQIDIEKLGIIGLELDHDKQRELLKQAGDMTREQLRQRAHRKDQPATLKTSVARFALPKGIIVTVQGPRIDLCAAIEALMETLRACKKAQADSLDIVTCSRVTKDRSRAAS